MPYRIEFREGYPKKVSSRNELLKEIGETKREIVDIRKIYKSGVEDSVFDKYEKYIDK